MARRKRKPLVSIPSTAKRVLFMGDLHCGHRVGLTPPDWMFPDPSDAIRYKWSKVQRQCWDFYSSKIREWGPFDVVVVNGDLIDGKGYRSGGTELITTDRHEQCEMASQCIRPAMTDDTKLIITRGTPYHTGSNEDFEDVIARDLGALKIGNHEWLDIEGVCFDVRHAVGGTSVPYGRGTQVAKARVWNVLWSAARKEAPLANVIIRSHVHIFHAVREADWSGYSLPALQSLGSKFGAKLCDGTVDFGFMIFDVWDGHYHEIEIMKTVDAAVPKVIQL